MKFRVRLIKQTRPIEVEDNITLEQLKSKIIQEKLFVGLPSSFDISLNGKTPISNSTNILLKEAGLAGGDLIKIINVGESSTSNTVTPQAQTTTSNMENLATDKESLMSVDIVANAENETVGTSTAYVRPYISPGVKLLEECINEEATPYHLQELYAEEQVKCEFEALVMCCHTLMCEGGFTFNSTGVVHEALKNFHGPSWAMQYNHATVGQNLTFTLTCTSLGPFMLINGIVTPCENTQPEPLTLQLKIEEFANKFTLGTKPFHVSSACKNLPKFSRTFKEKIVHPAMNAMREELELPPIFGLLSLFPELLMKILSLLDVKSLCSVSQICRTMRSFADRDGLWRTLYIRDFKTRPMDDNNCKQSYADKYKAEKAIREERERQRRHFEERDIFGGVPDPNSGFPPMVPFPTQPSGIIGGEYDRRPTFPFGPFGSNPFQPQSGIPPNNPFPIRPTHPDNPLPGSRFDPMYPGGFRPGRGGGMRDDDDEIWMNMRPPQAPHNRRPPSNRRPPDMPPFM